MPDAVSPRLLAAVAALLALLAGHDLSHAFDDGLDTSASGLLLVAVPQWLVLAVVLVVVVRGGRLRGAQMALALGIGAVVGFTAVHVLPFAPAPYQDLDPSRISWALLWLPTVVGAVVAVFAVRDLTAGTSGSRNRGLALAREARPRCRGPR